MPIVYDPPTIGGADVTFDELTDEILSNVEGFTAATNAVTSLVNPITADALEMVVDDPSNIERGILEVGDELVWVARVDATTGTLTLLPKGRGWRATIPASHDAGTTVVPSPVVPRAVIRRELNNQIASLYPGVYGVKSTTFTFDDPTKTTWALPDEAESVLDVNYQDNLGNWQRVRRWELEVGMDTAMGVRIDVPLVGALVQVKYGVRVDPGPVGAQTTLAGMGLSPGVKDVMLYGCLARLLPMLDVSRLSVKAVPADLLDQPNPLGSAVKIAKEFRDLADTALTRERAVLAARYPARVHWTR